MMNVTDYDNMSYGYKDSLSENDNCIIKENIFDIVIPTLSPIIPCGLSFYCLGSLMVYTILNFYSIKND